MLQQLQNTTVPKRVIFSRLLYFQHVFPLPEEPPYPNLPCPPPHTHTPFCVQDSAPVVYALWMPVKLTWVLSSKIWRSFLSRAPPSTAFMGFLLISQGSSSKAATRRGPQWAIGSAPLFQGLLYHPNPQMTSSGPRHLIQCDLAPLTIAEGTRCGYVVFEPVSFLPRNLAFEPRESQTLFGWLDRQYHLPPFVRNREEQSQHMERSRDGR